MLVFVTGGPLIILVSFALLHSMSLPHGITRSTCNPPWFWRSFINLNLKWLFKFSCRIISSRLITALMILLFEELLKYGFTFWTWWSVSCVRLYTLGRLAYTFCVQLLGTKNSVTRIHHFNGYRLNNVLRYPFCFSTFNGYLILRCEFD